MKFDKLEKKLIKSKKSMEKYRLKYFEEKLKVHNLTEELSSETERILDIKKGDIFDVNPGRLSETYYLQQFSSIIIGKIQIEVTNVGTKFISLKVLEGYVIRKLYNMENHDKTTFRVTKKNFNKFIIKNDYYNQFIKRESSLENLLSI